MWIQDQFNNFAIQSIPQQNDLPKQQPKSGDKKKSKTKLKQKQITLTPLDHNETLISEAYRLQSAERIEESIDVLEKASFNLIDLIGKLQGSSDFQMKAMPAMREERQLIPEPIIDYFWSENESLLNKDYEQNTYYMLLMRELEEKKDETKWKIEDQQLLDELCSRGEKIDVIISRLSHKSAKEVTGRVYRWQPKI